MTTNHTEALARVIADEGWFDSWGACNTLAQAILASPVMAERDAQIRAGERAGIVDWLRKQATCGCNGSEGWCNTDGPPLAFADAIEARQHEGSSHEA